MNELKKKRVENMYKDYYKMYNQGARQMFDKKPNTQVSGLASWRERTACIQPVNNNKEEK